MNSKISHDIKHREHPKDKFYTPPELAKYLINLVPLEKGDIVLDPCRGKGAFFNNFPSYVSKCWAEIDEGRDFFNEEYCDWCITNPPYSMIDNWLKHSCEICEKGFAYLIGLDNYTARRMELCNSYGFGLSIMHIFKVFKWYGMSCFLVFQKGYNNIIGYNRKVWREDI